MEIAKRKRQELEEEVTNSSNTSSRSSANCVNQLTEMLNYSSFLKGPEEQTFGPEFVPVETSYNHQNDPRTHTQSYAFACDPLPETERIVATTKVTIPQDGQGAIRAESTIETASLQARQMNALGGIEYIDEAHACTPQKSISTPATVKPITPVITPSTTGTLKRAIL
ncbi:uncharacterized protein ACN427_001274 [Glossina fuscipes fuscipes]